MPIDQYVNLPCDPEKNHGRLVFIVVDVSEALPGAARGSPVWFFVEPGGGNMPLTKLSADARQTGAHLTPPNRAFGLVDRNKRAWTGLRVSIAGGDTFKFKAGAIKDGSGAMPATEPDQVTVWRRIYMQVGAMPGCKGSVHGQIQGILESHFIEMDVLGGAADLTAAPIIKTMLDILDDARKQIAPPDAEKRPLTMQLLYVDRILVDAWKTITKTLVGKAVSSSGNVRFKLDGQLTWPDDTSWLQGRIRMLQPNGDVAHDLNDTRVRRITRKSRSGYRHPEGRASAEVIIELGKYGSRIAEWIRDEGVTLEITLRVRIIESNPLGQAAKSLRVCVSSLRDQKYQKADAARSLCVTLHEVGHLLGLVVQKNPTYDATTGAETSAPDYADWYVGNGGVGNHCGKGATKTATQWYGGSCVMCGLLHKASPTTFCADCTEMLKRRDLTKLG